MTAGARSMVLHASGLIEDISDLEPYEKVREVNWFVNHRMKRASDHDPKVHHRAEYWQAPAETLDLGAGDCEDAAILKMWMLMRAGIPADELALDTFAIYREGWLPATAHAVVRWRNSYILDLPDDEPIPVGTYYGSRAKEHYTATGLGRPITYRAVVLFSGVAGSYNNNIRSSDDADWQWVKRRAEGVLAALAGDNRIH